VIILNYDFDRKPSKTKRFRQVEEEPSLMQTLGQKSRGPERILQSVLDYQGKYLEENHIAYINNRYLVGPAQKYKLFVSTYDVYVTKEREWRCVYRSNKDTLKRRQK